MSPWKSLESCHHFLNEETGAQRTRDLVFRWYLLNGNHCSAFPGGNQSHCSQPVREERVSGVLGAGWASSSPLEGRGLACTIMIGRVISPLVRLCLGAVFKGVRCSWPQLKSLPQEVTSPSSHGSSTLNSAHVMNRGVSWIVKE